MPGLDYSALRFWFDVLQVAIMAAIGLYLYIQRREAVSSKALNDFAVSMRKAVDGLSVSVNARMEKKDRRIDELGERVSTIESRCHERQKNCPSHKDLGQAYERINEVGKQLSDRHDETATQVGEVAGEIRAMRRGMDMIHEHLLKQSKGG